MTRAAMFELTIRLMAFVSALACLVNAIEMLRIRDSWSRAGTWRDETLASSWGLWRPLLREQAFARMQHVQIVAASVLVLAASDAIVLSSIPFDAAALPCTAILCGTHVLAAMRFRGTVNGGSDGMLFTVLAALVVSAGTSLPMGVREGAVVYVAAQLTLSYGRAALVKIRERGWWTGASLHAFLQLPAYGVPAVVPRHGRVLQLAGVLVLCFEAAAPLAWMSQRAALLYIGVALTFHLAAALVFGLNRFVLAWGAAMPALWYAAARL